MKNLFKGVLVLGLIALWAVSAIAVESSSPEGTVTGPDTSDCPAGQDCTEMNFGADTNSSE